MSVWIASLLTLLIGYLVGSVSFAVLICKSQGVDIFKLGSGNPGATNVLRNLGKKWGYLCFGLDALKGVIPVLVGWGIASAMGVNAPLLGVLGLVGAILGHSYSLFLRFKGGKGVATTIGGLLVLMPVVILVGLLLWLAVFYTSRYVSLASIVLGVSLPITALILREPAIYFWVALALAVLIVVRHRANIQRLLNGTENRAAPKKK
ncbi:MAG: glycerol-3-phosphate 1-O-acyltransferase PlsY [Verrucomicrobiota bacterium JB022]|nr:glycerol-3-phosphate 1-O-acyltransferase PlsY [Verrucomicrobiota bacterium JB022]